MQITVQCPICGTEAQLDDSLVGRKLRCGNQDCRRTFRLTPDGEALPVIDKSVATPVQQAGDWQDAPPPMGDEGYVVGQDGAWQETAPPPRQGGEWTPPADYSPTGDAPVYEAEVAHEYAAEGHAAAQPAQGAYAEGYGYGGGYSDYTQYRRRSNKGLKIIIGLLVVGFIGIIAIVFLYNRSVTTGRQLLEEQALKDFNAHEWYEAKPKYEQLKQKFPDAAEKYDYFLQRCQLEIDAKEGASDPKKLEETVKSLETFVTAWSSKPNKKDYEERGGEIWLVAMNLADNALDTAKGRGDRGPSPDLLPVAESALKIAKAHANEVNAAERDKRQKNTDQKKLQVQRVVDITRDRAKFLADVESIAKEANITRVDELYEQQRRLELKYEPLRNDPGLKPSLDGMFAAATKALADLRAREREWVAYSAERSEAEKAAMADEGLSIVASPALIAPTGKATAPAKDEAIVLAVARGTLYGLSAQTGEARWAMRVGIDTQGLPARAEVRPDQPDLAYVTAQDAQGQNTINCIDVRTGKIVWSRLMDIACPAGPSLIGGRLYVPLLNGRLEVIDTATGSRLGLFDFRLRLTVPPAWDKATNRLFVPAEQNRIFVMQLDPPAPQKPSCVEVIYTGHRAGSIRGGLVVTQGLLVFAEAVSVDAMQVRAFSIKDPRKSVLIDLDPEKRRGDRIPGLAAYAPRQDDDTIAFLSDKGYFALYGTNRNLSDDERPLASLSGGALGVAWAEGTDPDSVQPQGPAQIVDVQLNDWSVLVGPWLYRKRFDPYRKQLVSGETPRLLLGTPLHAPALSPDSRHFIAVTLLGSRVQATAINRVTGAVAWQRQLGMLLTQEPARLGNTVLALDQSGTLGRITGAPVAEKDSQWIPLDDWPALPKEQFPSRLAVAPGGKLAVTYAYNPGTRQLLLRQLTVAGGPATEQIIALASPPWGTAAVSDDGVLMVPCRDGNLREFSVARSVSSVALNWRAPTAKASSRGHAQFLSSRQLVATDGERRVLRWNRGEDNSWRQVDAIEVASASNFMTPLAVVKPNDAVTQVAVGDDKGTIHLVTVLGGQGQQQLADGGTITQGPVVLGPRRFAWVRESREGRQLVLWEAGSDQPGRYPSSPTTTEEFVGLPQQIGAYILVTEQGSQAGRVTWLQSNGSLMGQVSFTRNLTPTAGGVALDAKRALVPLSDGTLRLVDIPQK